MKRFTFAFLFLLGNLVLVAAASATTLDPDVIGECSHRLEDVPGSWKKAEKWAWNDRFCIGHAEANFNQMPAESGPKTDGEPCRRSELLSPTFIRRLLTYGPMKEILDYYSITSITLECAAVEEHLNMQNIHSDVQITFDDFLFEKGLSANWSRFPAFGIVDSEINGNPSEDGKSGAFDGGGMEVNGILRFRNNRINSDVVLSSTKITDSIFLYDTQLTDGDINLIHSQVFGEIHLGRSDPSYRCELKGNPDDARVQLAFATINGTLQIVSCDIEGSVNLIDARIGGYIKLFDTEISRDLTMQRLDVSSDVLLLNPIVRGRIDAYRSSVAGNMTIVGSGETGKICKIEGVAGDTKDSTAPLNLGHAHVGGEFIVQNCDISEVESGFAGLRAIDARLGEFRVSGSTVNDGLFIDRMQVRKSLVISDLELPGFRREMLVKGDIKARRVMVGDNIVVDTIGWENMDLSESNVGGELSLLRDGKCFDSQQRNIKLYNVHLNGIDDRDDHTLSCIWGHLSVDVRGWTFDSEPFQNSSDRSLDFFVKWLSNKQEGPEGHVPHPYIQLANGLDRLGRSEIANEIRILERRNNLEYARGVEGAWQWIVGETTGFGYSPGKALYWLLFLVFMGTLIVRLADCKGGAEFRRKFPYIYKGILIFPILILLCTYFVARESWTWNWLGYGGILSVAFFFGWLSLGARELGLRNSNSGSQEKKGRRQLVTWGAVLYSIDRAVPFLSFDSEHIAWFEQDRRLNDIPSLCVYFYIHSIMGFALTSLFIAGLTGVLK